jgi:hypothetical protein
MIQKRATATITIQVYFNEGLSYGLMCWLGVEHRVAAQLNVQVGVPRMGRIEDAHMIVCHMIAYLLHRQRAVTGGFPRARKKSLTWGIFPLL